jgi:hypothetical protein
MDKLIIERKISNTIKKFEEMLWKLVTE